jgi:hypothetical protein
MLNVNLVRFTGSNVNAFHNSQVRYNFSALKGLSQDTFCFKGSDDKVDPELRRLGEGVQEGKFSAAQTIQTFVATGEIRSTDANLAYINELLEHGKTAGHTYLEKARDIMDTNLGNK